MRRNSKLRWMIFDQLMRTLVIGSGTIMRKILIEWYFHSHVFRSHRKLLCTRIGEQGEHSEIKIRETLALNREEDCKKLFRILKQCASFDDHSENFSGHFSGQT